VLKQRLFVHAGQYRIYYVSVVQEVHANTAANMLEKLTRTITVQYQHLLMIP
jgi:hypothetical protein